MKFLALLLMVCCTSAITFSTGLSQIFSYTDPLPAAELVNIKTGLILRPAAGVNISQFLTNDLISLEGTKSGIISFSKLTSDDGLVLLLKPNLIFQNAEIITITLAAGINTPNGTTTEPVTYTFKTRLFEVRIPPLVGLINELTPDQIAAMKSGSGNSNLDSDFPNITVSYSDQPTPGYLFMSNIVFDQNIPNVSDIIILNNNGSPHFYRTIGNNAYNFDKQPNGTLTYFDLYKEKSYALNSSYNVIDSFSTGNGYTADLHELRVLPNGHALLLSYDPEAVDMSLIYPGGYNNATVVGLIIQEIDVNKNVVFQWRSWDHFNILDATHESFTAYYIDYVHGNALEPDNDGNIMLSSRHMDEITKINRQTGAIIWRLGGKHNQFTFLNDPEKFSHQHAIRRIANGNITLFDNGNFHTPPHSRAVEYSLDEVNKTISIVWQYRNNPDYYGYAMGYVQRLANNNTLISWGADNPTVTEVKYDGTKEFEMTFDQNIFSYRVFRYQWLDTLTGITPVSNTAESFSLSQNYPNPFNPSTNIKFDIPLLSFGEGNAPEARGVRLCVFNSLGQEIAVLVNNQLQPGTYEVTWDASKYPSGVYFYRLEAGDNSETKKMLMIK